MMIRLDWGAIAFGHPPARFHTSGTNEQYLRVYRANDIHSQEPEQYDIEISLGVPSDMKTAILRVMLAEMPGSRCV